MIIYQHHLGDYATATKDLTPLEHGVYRLLLDNNYATEEPLPNELEPLYRIVGAANAAERKAVKKVADRFFPVNGDGRRHNKRVEAEIAKAKEKSAKAKQSASERWEKRNANASAFGCENDANAMLTNTQDPRPKEGQELSPADAGEVRDAVAAVPDCPHEKLIEAYHELLPTCTQVVEWNDTRKSLMRARWREKSMPKGSHAGYQTVEAGLAYWRRFFGYVSQSDFLTGRANPAPGRKPFVASLEWLVRPTNFAKVIEGTYHN